MVRLYPFASIVYTMFENSHTRVHVHLNYRKIILICDFIWYCVICAVFAPFGASCTTIMQP